MRNPFPFVHKPNTLDRDRIVVPGGWDSWGKIVVLRDGFDAKAWGEAWLRDLPSIYPLEVVDCHSTGPRREISACIDPQVLLIRSRTDLPQNGLRTARL